MEGTKTIKCPQCLNFMKAKVHENGCYGGQCPRCRAVVFIREKSARETNIRIIKA